MRKISATFGMMMLAATVWGCADSTDVSTDRHNTPTTTESQPGTNAPASDQPVTVTGTISNEGDGIAQRGLAGKDILVLGTKVVVSQLKENGVLVPIGEAPIKADGTYEVKLSPKDAAGMLIVSVQDVANSVLGSAVLNGIPAFAKAYLIDLPIDVITSFKTEVLMVLAKGGIPGLQNYLNVLNTFLDDELTGFIIVGGAFLSDFSAIFSSIAESIVATENVIIATLQAAGLPIDLSAITNAQLAAINGFKKTLTDLQGTVTTAAKNLVAAFQEATAKAAAPVDKALYNAIVAGGAMWNSILKGILPAKLGGGFGSGTDNGNNLLFQIFKSAFQLESLVSLDNMDTLFKQLGVDPSLIDGVKAAGENFIAQIAAAANMQALADAKNAFNDIFLGKKATPNGNILEMLANAIKGSVQTTLNNISAFLAPIAATLATALNKLQLTDGSITDALAQFDNDTKDVVTQLQQNMNPKEAEAIAEALKMTAKAFLP